MRAAGTHRSHWHSSAPWCCLLSAHCHTEDKPLALRRQNKLVKVFKKGYDLILIGCVVIPLSGQISCYLTADLRASVSLQLRSSRTALLCISGTVVRADLLWCEYTVQQLEWCLPRSPTVQRVFILALVYFAGAGLVFAKQKGKRCSHRSWTGWKVIQCPDTGSTYSARQATHCGPAGGNQSNKFSLFSTRNLWSCLLCSKACLASLSFRTAESDDLLDIEEAQTWHYALLIGLLPHFTFCLPHGAGDKKDSRDIFINRAARKSPVFISQ